MTITVYAVNDAPVCTTPATFTVAEDGVLGAFDFTDQCTDIDGDDLTIAWDTDFGFATPTKTSVGWSEATFPADWNGADAALVLAFDGSAYSNTVSLNITVTAVNDDPVAVNDTASMDENGPATDFPVLANDTDVEGDTLTLTGVTGAGVTGTASVVANEVRFQPATLFDGEVLLTYAISDGEGGTDTGSLTITVVRDTVRPLVTAPTMTIFVPRTMSELVPVTVNWTALDPWTGVAGIEVQMRIGTAGWKPLYSGLATSRNLTLAGNRTYTFRVRATDREGNASFWSTSAPRTLRVLQSNSTSVRYTAQPVVLPGGSRLVRHRLPLHDHAQPHRDLHLHREVRRVGRAQGPQLRLGQGLRGRHLRRPGQPVRHEQPVRPDRLVPELGVERHPHDPPRRRGDRQARGRRRLHRDELTLGSRPASRPPGPREGPGGRSLFPAGDAGRRAYWIDVPTPLPLPSGSPPRDTGDHPGCLRGGIGSTTPSTTSWPAAPSR